MKEELERLSSLGVQKIYDDTHIPSPHIQALLHSSFDSFSKVQFLGFISILEREYNVKLPKLKAAGLEYLNEKDARSLDEGLIVMPRKKRTKAPLYITVTLIILILVVFVKFFIFKNANVVENSIDNTLIHDVQKNIIEANQSSAEQLSQVAVADTNESNKSEELQESFVPLKVETEKKAAAVSFKIIPRTKVWLGYIDVDTNKKRQITLNEELNLDANKSWLLLFGHGYIDMYIDGDIQKFDSRNKKRFLYKNGTLKTISSDEFQTLNRGFKW